MVNHEANTSPHLDPQPEIKRVMSTDDRTILTTCQTHGWLG